MADFDIQILRDRLVFSVPLQKLYEKIYFEDWDLVKAVSPYDRLRDGTVTEDDFERVIFANVSSLDRDEVDQLTHMVPRIDRSVGVEREYHGNYRGLAAARKELMETCVIFYVKLYNVIMDLARIQYPINMLYERFEVKPKVDALNQFEESREIKELFNFYDPRLQHLTTNYSREKLQI